MSIPSLPGRGDLRGLPDPVELVGHQPGELPLRDAGLEDLLHVEAGALPVGEEPLAVDDLPLGGLLGVTADEEGGPLLRVDEGSVDAGHGSLSFWVVRGCWFFPTF